MTELQVFVTTLEGDIPAVSSSHDEMLLLRRDVVTSKDDPNRVVIVETTRGQSPSTFNVDGKSVSVTKWNVLFPDPLVPSNFNVPIHGDPLYFLVYFYIKPDCVSEFIQLLLEEAELVHKLEKKSIRFDLWQSSEDPTKFVVLEVVQDWAAIEEHKAYPHYQKVRKALESMQAKPRSHDKGYKLQQQLQHEN